MRKPLYPWDQGYYPEVNDGGYYLRRNIITGWDGSGFRAKINFQNLDGSQSWAFDSIADPYELYQALDLFRDKFLLTAEKLTFPQETARTIFEITQLRKAPKLSDNNGVYFRPFKETPAREIISMRDLTKDEKKMPFVHAFDKRMMFLSAARNVHVGEFEYTEIEKKLSDIPKTAAGIVDAEIKFPDPVISGLYEDKGRFWLPTLRLFAENPQTIIKIKKAWLWNDTQRLFEKFAKRIGDVIKDLRESDLPEYQAANRAAKECYVKFFGWLGRECGCDYCGGRSAEMNGCKINGWSGPLYRPDWRGMIISEAYANLLRNVIEVRTKFGGLQPFAIDHDCVMYFSNYRDPMFEFRGSPLMDPNRFTHEWTLPGDVVRRAIKDGYGPGRIDGLGKSEGLKDGE